MIHDLVKTHYGATRPSLPSSAIKIPYRIKLAHNPLFPQAFAENLELLTAPTLQWIL